MVRIRLAGCSDPDRQTGSDTSRYFGKSTFFFFSESRRGPVTPPASPVTPTVCDPEILWARMLEICNFRHPWYLRGCCPVPTQILGQVSRGNAANISGWDQQEKKKRGAATFGNNWCLQRSAVRSRLGKGGYRVQSSDLQPTLRNVTFSAHFSLQIVSSHSSAKIVLQLPSSAFVFQQMCSLNSKCRSADFLFDQLFLRYLFPMHFTVVHFCLQVGILFPVFQSLFISQASHKYPKVWADYKKKSKLVAAVKHILTALEYLSSILFHCKTSASSVFQFGIWTSSRKRCGRKLHWNCGWHPFLNFHCTLLLQDVTD